MTRPTRLARHLAWGATAVALLAAAPGAVVSTAVRLGDALEHRGESALDARRRLFGAAYADGIEEIRRRLPRDAAYYLVEAAGSDSFWWVQYDLAPRRARLVGGDAYLTPERFAREPRLPPVPEWVVVCRGNDAPRLVPSAAPPARRTSP